MYWRSAQRKKKSWAVRGNGRHAHTVRATAGKFAYAPGGTVGQAACHGQGSRKFSPTRHAPPKSRGRVPRLGKNVKPRPRPSAGDLDTWTDSPGREEPSSRSTGKGEARRRELRNFKISPKIPTGGPRGASRQRSRDLGRGLKWLPQTPCKASRWSASPATRNSDSWARRVCPRTSPPPVDSGTRLAVSPRAWTRRGVRPGRSRQDPAALGHRRGRPEVPQVGEKTSSRRGGKGQLTQVSHGGVDRRAAGRGLPLMALRKWVRPRERFSRDAISSGQKSPPDRV